MLKRMINYYFDKYYGKITSAAIRKNNQIYIAKNHSLCLQKAPMGYLRDGEQGFVTEQNKFVDRKTAFKIAKHYNQIIKKHGTKDVLFSEDIME